MGFLNVQNSPVYDELERQKAIDRERIDATKLWIAGGRKPSMSPRRKLKGVWPIISDLGGSASNPVIVDGDVALIYAQYLDPKITFAVHEVVFSMMRQDPAKVIMEGKGGPLVAMFAVSAELANNGGTPDEAASRIVREVSDRTADEGIWRQETRVAEAQRAVMPGRKAIRIKPEA